MTFKKKLFIVLVAVLFVLINVAVIRHAGGTVDNVTLQMTYTSDVKGTVRVYYQTNQNYTVEKSESQDIKETDEETTVKYSIPSDVQYMRIDFGGNPQKFVISKLAFVYRNETEDVDLSAYTAKNALTSYEITNSDLTDGKLVVKTSADASFITAKAGPVTLAPKVASHMQQVTLIKKILVLAVLYIGCLVLFKFRKKFASLPTELYHNRRLIMQLAKNDFKTKYAGSVLGITWAFVQPTVTVLVYWFVFQVGLHSGDVATAHGTYPFVLWLICGLVPWFFFQDTISGGTNALIEYSYLVKKVVFKISILPIVKEISALFVHLFFIALMIVIFTLTGHFPDLYVLQVIYYTFSLFIYSLGVCYAFCAIVIFFRDLTQIISIIIQVQVWLTPIMWNIDVLGASMPGWVSVIFKLNPLYYIVRGYRDAMMNKVWFWERFDLTIYFWIVTVVFFGLGAFIFKRLKVHFADIL